MDEKTKLMKLMYAMQHRLILTPEQEILGRRLGIDIDSYIQSIRNDINNQNISNNGENSNSSTMGSKENVKTLALSNGGKRLDTESYFNGNGFSDIYMFGFLVLMFQTLFLILGYIIFK